MCRSRAGLATALTMGAFELFVAPCIAQSNINTTFALQVCRAFAAKSPGKVPLGMRSGAAERFILVYSPFAATLGGCVSAVETSRTETSVTLLIQHVRFESHWTISLNGSSVDEILISDYRAITSAGDGKWQIPFLPLQ